MFIDEVDSPTQNETRAAESGVPADGNTHLPRKMTFMENVVLTIKILTGFGLLGVALWGAGLWTAAK